MKLTLVLISLSVGALAYMSPEKEALISDILLREVMLRMGKGLNDGSYIDFPGEGGAPLGPRSIGADLEEEQMYPLDYDGLGDGNLHPSIRDQEFLQHSSLWGSQLVSGGAGEGPQRLKPEGTLGNKQEIKTDATLPAYCNPPNPCPLGYGAEQGCLDNFENTASFSRRYQASQDCMCDSEHMFDCPNPVDSSSEDEAMEEALSDLEFNRFLQHTIQVDPSLRHKSLVAKKMYPKSDRINPFLIGERLPVAAKKGIHVLY